MKPGFVTLLLFFTLTTFSQQIPTIKFGKISEPDFQKSYAIDTGANAVVLADIGSSQIKGNSKEWFSLEHKHHRRIQILKNSGYDKASVEIRLYTDGDLEEKLDDLKAVTYNLENGKIVETKLNEKTAVFKEKLDKHTVVKKFTFPNVKEGSIIEYEYKITSDFLFNLQPWTFQGDIPRLWSQYTVSIPQFVTYASITQGYLPFYLKDSKDKVGRFTVVVSKDVTGYGATGNEDRVNFSCGVTDFRWAMKDIPALREEAFTTTMSNHVAKLEFQLSGYLEPLVEKKIITTWPELTDRLLKQDEFGGQLAHIEWLDDKIKPLLKGATNQMEKAKKIYEYVTNNFTCTDHSQLFPGQSLKKLMDKKNGGVAEINLLLTAMFRQAGLLADPVILSTRQNGYVQEDYPVAGRFNYVISRANINGQDMLFDATRDGMGFGKLHYDCYNGQARVVNEAATEISLKSDQLTEKKVLSLFATNDSNKKWAAHVSKLYGYYESNEVRKKAKLQGQESLLTELSNEFGTDIRVENLKVDSLSIIEEPVTVQFDISFKNETEDILYVNPLIMGRYKENPFKSADRQYPVELPYKVNEIYTLNMPVPEGYIVDEMPKPLTIKLNPNNDAVFEYNISKSGSQIMMRCKLEINRTIFYAAEYNSLREFFGMLVAKQNEQIVFKRK